MCLVNELKTWKENDGDARKYNSPDGLCDVIADIVYDDNGAS